MQNTTQAGSVETGGGGRPCLDSKLVHHPLHQVTSTSTTTTTTTSTTQTGITKLSPHAENQLQRIPLDLLLEIALSLSSSQDFASLLQTCRYVYYNLDTRWVWHQRFLMRLGRAMLLDLLNPRDSKTGELLGGRIEGVRDTSVVSKETLVEWYWMYTRTAVPPREMNLAHFENGFWEFVNDPRTPYGLAATLLSGLWWLDVSAVLYGVLPGRYWVQWGLALSNASSLNHTQFRVSAFSRNEIPVWDNEAKASVDYIPRTSRKFLHHTSATNKEKFDPTEALIFQVPKILVVEKDKPTLFVQMREHHSYKEGITVLFVRIIPAEDDEVDAREYDERRNSRPT